jgi:hypothetical protein
MQYRAFQLRPGAAAFRSQAPFEHNTGARGGGSAPLELPDVVAPTWCLVRVRVY